MGSSASAPQTRETATSDAMADVMALLFKERVVFLGSSIDDYVADAIMSQLMLLDAQNPTKDIRLFINSSGGSLSSTIAIVDTVQLLRSDVTTVAFGICASTASLILCSGSKGKRLAMPNARIMIHQPQGDASGIARNVEVEAREIMQNKNYVIRIISERSGRPYEQVEKDLDKDLYMSPIAAVDYGLIDGVIDREKIIPIPPLPERVKSRLNLEEIHKNLRKFVIPEIPDDEIY